MTRFSRLLYWLENLLFFWCGLTMILVIGGQNLVIPTWIQVFGRLHPLILHFPIVLLLLAVVYAWLPKKHWKSTGKNLLLFGANIAGITVVAGLILASEDYEGASLSWHKWLGILSLALSVAIYFLIKKQKQTLKISTSLLALALILTGHFGANLTHGEDFLLAPVLSKEVKLVAIEDAEVFRDMVQPILESKCISCHKEGKIKGELRMDHIEGLKKGGESGPLFLAGDPDNSTLLQRIHLPLEDEDHMPPKNKTQLTEDEIEILRLWVASGASFEQKVLEIDQQEPLFQLASNKFSTAKNYDFSPASASTVEELTNFFRKVKPLYPDSPALEVAYFGSSSFDPSSLTDLKKVKEQVVKVNLNRMPLKDVDLSLFAEFKNLEEVQLNFTEITASQLVPLQQVKTLQSLAISGNELGSEAVQILSQFTQLRNLYLWNSGLSESDQKQLSEALASTAIDFGYNDKGVIYALNPPKIEFEDEMFEGSTEIILSHPIRSTSIRYTLDGSEPDSVSGLVYSQPIRVTSTTSLRAKVYAPDWIGSEESVAKLYKKGLKPQDSKLMHRPNPKYAADQEATLFDGKKGKLNHGSGNWLGFSENPMELEIALSKDQKPNSLVASLLINEAAYIFPPQYMEVWVEKNGSWEKIPTPKPVQSTSAKDARFDFVQVELPQVSFEKVRIKLVPIQRLPVWHPGKGNKGWVFVDELFLY